MPSSLQPLMTSRYVVGFPEQRLSYLAEKIADEAADYCVVLQPRTYHYLGLLRIADIAASPSVETRILIDLLADDQHVDVPPDASWMTIERLLKKGRGAVPVTDELGGFVGLITNESYSAWLLARERRKVRALEKQLKRGPFEPQIPDDEGKSDDVVPFPTAPELDRDGDLADGRGR